MRNAEATRERILDAAAEILSSEGTNAIGINAIERKAGVGKPLLYRYFGGLDGIIEALGLRDGNDLPEGSDAMHRLIGAGRAIAPDRLKRDLIRLALDGRAEDLVPPLPEGPQRAEEAILLAGILFLLLWRDHHKDFAGVPLETSKDLAKLESVVAALAGDL